MRIRFLKKLILAGILALSFANPSAIRAQEPSEWRPAYLTRAAILDMVMGDNGQGWAVGEAGTILQRRNGRWQPVASPTQETLYAVAFVSANNGWAVGEAGTVLHYDGTDWQRATAPTTAADTLFDIALIDGQGWAVGKRFNPVFATVTGLILHLRDGVWTEVPIPQTQPLYAVAFTAADAGWAVGEDGTVLHWNGTMWAMQNRLTTIDLYDVTLAGENIWAVGDNGFIIRWNLRGGLRIEGMPYGVLVSIGFAGTDAGWAVGADGVVLRYDGHTWSPIPMPLSADLFGLFVDTDGIPWITGEGGLIGRVTPDGWQFDTQPYVDVDLTAIDMPDATAGWVVGSWPAASSPGVVFWRYAEPYWYPHEEREAPPLFDIAAASADEAWAVGSQLPPATTGVVWRYTANAWTVADAPDTSTLFAVETVGPGNVWVAGQDGTLAHYDGTEWHPVPMPENVHLYGLHFRAADDGWAVGTRLEITDRSSRYLAVAFHYNGTDWHETAVPPGPPRLLAVYALAENDVWAVGDLGAILHYDGEGWSVVQGQQDYNLLAVDFAGPGDGWAVGSNGTILRFHATTWTSVDSPTTETLKGVVSRPWGEGWAVGSRGAFLYHPPITPWRIYLPHIGR